MSPVATKTPAPVPASTGGELVAFPLTRNLVCVLPEEIADFLTFARKTDMSAALVYNFEHKCLDWCQVWHE